jgi:hypothetical protein
MDMFTPAASSPKTRSASLVTVKYDETEKVPAAIADAVSCAMLLQQKRKTNNSIGRMYFISMLMYKKDV